MNPGIWREVLALARKAHPRFRDGALLLKQDVVVARASGDDAQTAFEQIQAKLPDGSEARTLVLSAEATRATRGLRALQAHGLREVWVAAPLRNEGRPFEKVCATLGLKLRWAEASVQTRARALVFPRLFSAKARRPWVQLKVAASMDGAIAVPQAEGRYLSSPSSLREVHRLRHRAAAILVGRKTVALDDPMLTARGRGLSNPVRVVLDSQLRTSSTRQLVRTADRVPTLFFCRSDASAQKSARLEAAGVEVLRTHGTDAGLDLGAVLKTLWARGIDSVMVEGGGRVQGAFFDLDLVDEVQWVMSPFLVGDRNAPHALWGEGRSDASWTPLQHRTIGGDHWFSMARLRPGLPKRG